ncbi:MAG: 50S ribosomal protein L3 [Bacteroidetes bacterium]|nr:50S ribosomal protein L3 [Bacteroidota bacterium]
MLDEGEEIVWSALGERPSKIYVSIVNLEELHSTSDSARRVELGRAARALDQFRQANSYFRRAASVAAGDPAIHAAWGDLFLEKYNYPDAVRSYNDAVGIDSEWAPAHLGLGRALADENPPAAHAAAERALAIDPSGVAAHLFVAELALDAVRPADGRAAIERALELNPSSLEARALLGATAYVEDRVSDFDAEVARMLAINPVYGDAYRVAGALAARNYRFEEAVVLLRRAVELESDNTRAHAELGLHLLRTGDEPAAREALDRAFAADPFDVVTFNLLQLLDTLDGFETIRTDNLWVRLDRAEAPILKEYVVSLAEEALSELSDRYNFTPQGPILIEVFPKHDDFAVRNLGLPGMIGALGACFGRVVTMDSPRARRPGTFSWQSTLWHELAHVITLQMSNQRVPRWLTEGISVYEEGRARPEWGRNQELAFAHALNEDQVLKLQDLNAGFTSPDTISLAYYEASLLVEHLVASHGEQALHTMLRAFGEGVDTEEALLPVGARISAEHFIAGQKVDITGHTQGKGFAGVMKRHGFSGQRDSHGGMAHRRPGSIGQASFPAKVWKGQKMPGHYGAKKFTIQGLKVVKVDKENNIVLVKGSVPGTNGYCVYLKQTVK